MDQKYSVKCQTEVHLVAEESQTETLQQHEYHVKLSVFHSFKWGLIDRQSVLETQQFFFNKVSSYIHTGA